MQTRFPLLIALAATIAIPCAAYACLWDYDTLRQERARFPTTLEIITGKFLRHSPEFYQWRIDDRKAKLAADPANLSHYDDLAVAYEMTGQHAKAVETILAKDKIKPGLYETYSNLGTFHILAGDLEQGLPYIDKALAINPDAHFGRERNQKWLVEYALEKRQFGKLVFPLQSPDDELNAGQIQRGFYDYVGERMGEDGRIADEQLHAAVKGVLGMMRFANHANPLLLEALGDLLAQIDSDRESDAKRLAARCYLKASYEMQDEKSQQTFRERAVRVLRMQEDHSLMDLEAEFQAELADAKAWYEELRTQEISWIRDGKDVEAEFDRLYATVWASRK